MADFPQVSQTAARSSLDRVRDALVHAGQRIEPRGAKTFMATCPVHEDHTPSLHVEWKSGPDATLLYCHGCHASAQQITEALGLRLSDLYDRPLPVSQRRADRSSKSQTQRRGGKRRGKLGPLPKSLLNAAAAPTPEPEHHWTEVERYPYCDRDGVMVQEVVRESCACDGQAHKRFRQVFINDAGRAVKTKPAGFVSVLYRAPEVAAAVAAGGTVWLLEGEKDVHTAEAQGLVATTNTQGGASFPDHLVSELRGATVNIVLDRDSAGWARGVDLYGRLTTVGISVQLFLPRVEQAKADFTDHIEAGFTVSDLVPVDVEEVHAWHALKAVSDKAAAVHQACQEASARLEYLDEDPDTNRRYAHRWALEAQIRHEHLGDLARQVWSHGMQASTPWAGVAVDQARTLLDEATDAARQCHVVAGVAIPPTLAQDLPQPESPSTHYKPEDAPSDDRGRGQVPTGGAPLTNTAAFRVHNGQIWHHTPSRGGGEESGTWKIVLNTVLRVVAFTYRAQERPDPVAEHMLGLGRDEDGVYATLPGFSDAPVLEKPVRVSVRLEYPDPQTGEWMQHEVSDAEWQDHSYLDILPAQVARPNGDGFEPLDYNPSRTGKDLLRRAIINVSDPQDTIVYTKVGPVQSPFNSELDGFVHQRGLMTAEGMVRANTSLMSGLSRYNWPNPTQDSDELAQLFDSVVLDCLRSFPLRVSAPLWGHIFRGLLGPSEYAFLLLGSPRARKSGMAAIAMHFYGEYHDRTLPFASATRDGDTMNALALKASEAGSVVVHIDDFNKDEGVEKSQKKLDATIRIFANQTSKDRMGRDLRIREGGRPRCMALITTEVPPATESAEQRAFIVPLAADDIDLDQIKRLDVRDRRHQRALFGGSLCQWLLRRPRGEVLAYYKAIGDAYSEFLQAEHGHHERRSGALAQMWVGWTMALDWLEDVGAITQDQRRETEGLIEAGLIEAGQMADDPDENSAVGQRALGLLRRALTSGDVHVLDSRTGGMPPEPYTQLCGWTADDRGMPGDSRWIRSGKKIGYVRWDPKPERGEDPQQLLILDPAGLQEALRLGGRAVDNPLDADLATVLRALMEDGVLKWEQNGSRKRMRVKISLPAESTSRRWVVLQMDPVFNDDDDDDEGQGQAESQAAPNSPDGFDTPPGQDGGDEDTSGFDQPAMEVEMPVEAAEAGADLGEAEPGGTSDDAAQTDNPDPGGQEPADQAGAALAGFRAAAAVVDVDTIYLSNGETIPMPGEGPTHVGQLVELARWLRLGTQVTKYVTESGQIWVTSGLARHMGIDVDAIEAAKMTEKDEVAQSVTSQSPAITLAVEAGYTMSRGEHSLRRWTRVWHPEVKAKSTMIVLLPAVMGSSNEPDIAADSPEPAVLARRIGLVADALGMPLHNSPALTGVDLMKALRRKDADRLFVSCPMPEPAEITNLEIDWDWSRMPTDEEAQHPWVHSYDRSGSYPAGASGLELGVGEATHFEGGCEFDPKLPGYWQVEIPAAGDWRLPNPLDPSPFGASGRAGRTMWVATPALQYAIELGYDPQIEQAWVWQEHSRILDPWYERYRDARAALAGDDPDLKAAYRQVKNIANFAIGQFNFTGDRVKPVDQRSDTYAPHRRHMIQAKARINILRRIVTIGQATGRWPIEVKIDTISYSSTDPDPVAAWPGGDRWLGQQLGRYKPENTEPMEQVLARIAKRHGR